MITDLAEALNENLLPLFTMAVGVVAGYLLADLLGTLVGLGIGAGFGFYLDYHMTS